MLCVTACVAHCSCNTEQRSRGINRTLCPSIAYRSAPAVTPSTTNPVMLQCAAPIGGPWQTCKLQLCEEQGPGRRLLGAGGCTPVDLSCPFVNGVASCDVTGKIRQGIPYAITSTAVKSDGTRTSQTGPQGSYTLPYFP